MAFFFQSRRTPPPPAPDESTLNVPLRTFSFSAFGQEGSVTFLAPNGDEQAARYQAAARAAVATLEQRLSSQIATSAIAQINAQAGRGAVTVEPETDAFLKLCEAVPFMTSGSVDPTIGPLLRLWRTASSDGRMPAADEVARARSLVAWGKFQRSGQQAFLPEAGMGLDLSCVVYGLTADTLAQLGSAHAIPGVLARLGPASRSVGQPPGKSAWSVSFPDPKDPAGPGSTLELFNRAVASAGSLDHPIVIGERRFAPIIDLKTGWPVSNGVLQTIVTAPSAIQAGVLATAAFILGLPKAIDFLHSFPGCEGTVVTAETRGHTRGYLENARPAGG